MTTITVVALLVMLACFAVSLPVSIANLRDTRRQRRDAESGKAHG